MTYDDNGTRSPNGELNTLREELTASLLSREDGHAILHRHAHILDEILTLLMSDHLAENLKSGKGIERWLEMFLKVQKQCADTIKTAEAIDYMKACASRTALPPPPKIAKRTIKDTR